MTLSPLYCLFLSGLLRQVLLYHDSHMVIMKVELMISKYF